MSKRSYEELRKDILLLLNKENNLTYAQMERKLSTNPDSLRLHCRDLEKFGAIKITKKSSHIANGRPYFIVEITDFGKTILKKL